MITELLDAILNELQYQEKSNIKEFQLGEEPMRIFIDEAKQTMGSRVADIATITKYKGVSVTKHHSNDAVMFTLQINKQ